MVNSIAVGLQKGFLVKKIERPMRISKRRSTHKTSTKVAAVRAIVREVAGFAAYERRMVELLRVGREKRALKLAKRRLGTHQRAKKKREEMATVVRQSRKK